MPEPNSMFLPSIYDDEVILSAPDTCKYIQELQCVGSCVDGDFSKRIKFAIQSVILTSSVSNYITDYIVHLCS
jgi:hypothetical protein